MTILIIPPISNYCSPLARQCLSHTGSGRPICESIFLIIHNSSRGSACSAFLSTKPSLLVTKLESTEWSCRCVWGIQLLILPLLLSASLSLPMYLLLFGVCLCGAFSFGQERSMSLVQPTPDFSFVSAFVLLMSFY